MALPPSLAKVRARIERKAQSARSPDEHGLLRELLMLDDYFSSPTGTAYNAELRKSLTEIAGPAGPTCPCCGK